MRKGQRCIAAFNCVECGRFKHSPSGKAFDAKRRSEGRRESGLSLTSPHPSAFLQASPYGARASRGALVRAIVNSVQANRSFVRDLAAFRHAANVITIKNKAARPVCREHSGRMEGKPLLVGLSLSRLDLVLFMQELLPCKSSAVSKRTLPAPSHWKSNTRRSTELDRNVTTEINVRQMCNRAFQCSSDFPDS